MPRKGPAPRRELMPDPIYRSVLVTQIVNKVLHARQALAGRADRLRRPRHRRRTRRGGEPIATLKRAIENIKPAARGQEPPGRRRHLPGARRGPAPPGHHPRHPLARRLLPASAGRRRWPSASPTSCSTPPTASAPSVKRREDMHKMAESNKAFAHYRW